MEINNNDYVVKSKGALPGEDIPFDNYQDAITEATTRLQHEFGKIETIYSLSSPGGLGEITTVLMCSGHHKDFCSVSNVAEKGFGI